MAHSQFPLNFIAGLGICALPLAATNLEPPHVMCMRLLYKDHIKGVGALEKSHTDQSGKLNLI